MPIDPENLQQALAHARTPPVDSGLQPALDKVCRVTSDLFGVDGAGLLMIDDGHVLRSAAASDSAGELLERVQVEAGTGPCVEALVNDTVITCEDIWTDPRWPAVSAALRGSPVRAVMGIPTRVGGGAIGSLNVHRAEPHGWDVSEIDALGAFSEIIEHLIVSALLADAREALVQQLQHALDHRVVIERAIGVLMARHRVDPVAAFELLRSQARAERRKAVDVAGEILGGIEIG